MEIYEYIPVRGERLFVGLHLPEPSPPSPLRRGSGQALPRERGDRAQRGRGEGTHECAVIASPIHEEKKSAHRPLVDLARALAGCGVPCLRFDYVGTGDSSGEPAAVTLGSMTDDLRAAVEHAKRVSATEVVHLVGVRLGADIAALLAEEDPGIRSIVLVVPVVQGARYVREMRIRSRIRGAITDSEGGGPGLAPGVAVDFDGHPVSDEMIGELAAHDLCSRSARLAASVLCLDVKARAEPTAGLRKLGEALRSRGADVTVSAVVDEPFWNALGPVEPRAFTGAVVGRLRQGCVEQ